MRSQVVSMAFVTTVVFLVAAGAPFLQESLGLRAATLSSVTELICVTDRRLPHTIYTTQLCVPGW
jgi:hypothetical protein